MALPALRPLSVGEILDVSFQLYRRHFAALAMVALICSGLPVLLSLYIEASGGILQHVWLTLAYYGIFVVLSAIATAATVFIVSESYLGRPLSAAEALSRAAPLLWRVIACSVLTGVLVMVGFLFFVIPGFVVVCGVILAFPVLVLEPGTTANGALSRSWALTRGSRWRIFGMLVTIFLLLYIPIVALTALAALVFAELTHAIKQVFATTVAWPPARTFLGACLVIGLTYLVGDRAYLGLSIPLITGALAGGAGIAAGAFALQWLEFQFVVRTHATETYMVLLAVAFLGLGIYVGSRLFRRPAAGPFVPNTQVRDTLKVSDREFEVLTLLAEGRSNKEIARQLDVSPNTVKTHVASLFDKLEAKRRTEAISRARELGMIR